MVDLIVDLPIAPLAGILNVWLNAREVIRLDSAYCNKRYRPLLLQTLTAAYAVQHAVQIARQNTLSSKIDITYWMIKRNIKCINLTCESNCVQFAKSLETLLHLAGPTIQSLTFKIEEQRNSCLEEDWQPELFIKLPVPVAESVAKCCPKLRTLNCKFVHPLPLEVNNIVSNCKYLKVLNLRGCTKVSVEILNACSQAVHLEELIVKGCNFMTPFERVAGCVVPVCDSVRKLSAAQTNLCEKEILVLLESFPNLTELSVSAGKEVLFSDVTLNVAEVAQKCPLLEVCTIFSPAFVDKAAATIIGDTWRSIRNLTLQHPSRQLVCSEEAMVVLLQQCMTLQSLQLFWSGVKNEGDTPSHEDTSPNSNLSQLVNLLCMPINAASLKTILSVCPLLHSLYFLNPRIRGEVVNNTVVIEESLPLLQHSNVKVLTLEDCPLTPKGIASVTNVTEMYLQNCYGDVTNEDLIKMAQRCIQLNTLAIELPRRNFNWRLILGVLDVSPKLCKLVFKDFSYEGKNTAGMEAFTHMIKRCYPHVCDVQLNF